MHYTVRVLEGNICKRKSTRDIDTLCKHNHRQFFLKQLESLLKNLYLIYTCTQNYKVAIKKEICMVCLVLNVQKHKSAEMYFFRRIIFPNLSMGRLSLIHLALWGTLYKTTNSFPL